MSTFSRPNEPEARYAFPSNGTLRAATTPHGTKHMAARVIHFGVDDCHRLMVLRSAGYSVDNCDSLGQLITKLETDGEADAVVMSDCDGISTEEAASLARTHTKAPVVLFRSTNRSVEESAFDLVVHSLTPPEVWLNEVDALIAQCQMLRVQSAIPTRESQLLRR
jgi:hypothetical protein